MHGFCLTAARLCSAIWVGAALLFVFTSVTEQLEPAFDIAVRNRLAMIRFPWFYGTGAVLLIAATCATACLALRRRTALVAFVLLSAALAVMAGDYAFVYRPLRASLNPPGAARGAEFQRLHAWSERLNSLGFLLSAGAAATLCAAERKRG